MQTVPLASRRSLLAACVLLTASVRAEDAFPSRAITLMVPQSPGTAVDNISRVIARMLGARLGQPVIVENKPGASGNLAVNAVFQAAPDGYTLLVPATNFSIAPFVTKGLAWDPVRDFAPIAMPAVGPVAVFANPSFEAQTLAQLIALAKAQPGKIYYGSSGKGTPHHLAMTQLQQAAGIELFHVPFKSIGDLVTAVLGAHVPLGIAAPGNLFAHAKAGKLRILTVSAPARLPQLPDVPTLRELGLAKAEIEVWIGLFAPARTPRDAVAVLSREMAVVMAAPEYRQALDALGFLVPVPGDAGQMGRQVRAEQTSMPPLLKAAGITDND